jgi:colanic acid/amylovoran biosynthesis glycosyltransferase
VSDSLIVLHSCPVWLPQTQIWLYNQVRSLPVGIESHIACIGTENLDSFPHPNIHSMGRSSTIAYRTEALLRRVGLPIQPLWLQVLARRCKTALLHSHFGNMGWLNLAVSRKQRLPHVVTFYGLDVDYLPQQDAKWRNRYLQLFAEVDMILCEGPHMASRIVARGCPVEKVHVHHLGIDTAAIPFRPRSFEPGQPLKILIAGAFREKKGIPYAIEALGRLRGRIPLDISVIGDSGTEPRSREEKQHILDTIRHQQLEPHVRLLGFQPHGILMREAYRCHVFISPSVHAEDGDNEGGAPVSIIEMAASGMPVVSTAHCDIPEVIGSGSASRLLTPERCIDSLAERLEWLIEHPNDWHELLIEVRRRIETEFDMMKQGIHLAEVYRSLVDRRH